MSELPVGLFSSPDGCEAAEVPGFARMAVTRGVA